MINRNAERRTLAHSRKSSFTKSLENFRFAGYYGSQSQEPAGAGAFVREVYLWERRNQKVSGGGKKGVHPCGIRR